MLAILHLPRPTPRHDSAPAAVKRGGNVVRGGIFLGPFRLTKRAAHVGPHGAHVRGAERTRADRRPWVILPRSALDFEASTTAGGAHKGTARATATIRCHHTGAHALPHQCGGVKAASFVGSRTSRVCLAAMYSLRPKAGRVFVCAVFVKLANKSGKTFRVGVSLISPAHLHVRAVATDGSCVYIV